MRYGKDLLMYHGLRPLPYWLIVPTLRNAAIYLTKYQSCVTTKTISNLERNHSNNNYNPYEASLKYRFRKLAAGALVVAAAFGFNSWSHEDNADNAPKELACVSEQTTYGEHNETISGLSKGFEEKDGVGYRTAVQYDTQLMQAQHYDTPIKKDTPVNVTVCRPDYGDLEARVDTIGSHPEESDR